MRILVLSNEVWNDKINGNNVTSNWFEGMEAEFANIYASPGIPYNNCCEKYFQITDVMMLKSIIKKKWAGKALNKISIESEKKIVDAELEPQKFYRFMKKISGNFLRLIREMLWMWGKYDVNAMKIFIEDFQPDVIFSERMATVKMLRLERIVSKMTNAPIYAFTGDDEYSLKQFSLSPFFWINRFMVRKYLRKNVNLYEIYYMLSIEQKRYYENVFGCHCELLYKCGQFKKSYNGKHKVHQPIKLVYAGKFYCNRWKALAEIAKTIQLINKKGVKMVLEIYTKDKPTLKQSRLLNDGINSVIKGPVTQEALKDIYSRSDVALHVESTDLKNKLKTRFSFSTKIIDCIFSGCAVMAYCWEQHSGLTYLMEEDAAICVTSRTELYQTLKRMCLDPGIIDEYAYKAYLCGKRNHDRIQVQKMLLEDFSKKNNV